MKHRVAFIGFGTIAADVAHGLRKQPDDYIMAALCRRPDATLPDDVQRLDDFVDMLSWHPDLVVEVAGQSAVREQVESSLRAGIAVLVTSIGALADDTLKQQLYDAAHAGKTQLIIPAGAVASLDYLGAVRHAEGVRVTYESRKPVSAWESELSKLGHDVGSLQDPVVLYEGDAATAAQKYPQNLNVAATLALAGVGMQDTQVRVVADPDVSHNQHTIHVESSLGTLSTQLVNQPSRTNPKTSGLVAQSVLAAVRRQFGRVVVG